MLNIPTKLENAHASFQKTWVKSHLIVNILSVLLVTLTEVLIFFLFRALGFFETSPEKYLIYFLLIPFAINATSVLIQIFCYRSNFVPEALMPYILSVGLAICCFIVELVHCCYQSLTFVMVIPIVVSVIYGSRRVTTVTTVICMVLNLLNCFVFEYDIDKPNPYTDIDALVGYIVSFAAQACLIIGCFKILAFEKTRFALVEKYESDKKMLEDEARTDRLTGLYNRSALSDCCREIIAESTTDSSNSYIFVMADMDYFKQVNDNFGHGTGDLRLALIGEIIAKHCNGGLAFRYGGDEFCMIYKNVPFNAVQKDCQDIQEEFYARLDDATRVLGVSMSFGIAQGMSGTAPSKILQDADEQLYLAKKERGSIRVKY